MITLNQFINQLEAQNVDQLHIMLPDGKFIPSHFHVTEVGLVTKKFVDCGGILREDNSCCLQIWVADDINHRLSSEKLVSILKIGKTSIGIDDLPVEVEYGFGVKSIYSLMDVRRSEEHTSELQSH